MFLHFSPKNVLPLPKSVADINMGRNIFLGAFLKIFLHFSPGSAQVGGPKAAPFGPPRFSSSRGAIQRSRGAAAYPGSMVIRALLAVSSCDDCIILKLCGNNHTNTQCSLSVHVQQTLHWFYHTKHTDRNHYAIIINFYS